MIVFAVAAFATASSAQAVTYLQLGTSNTSNATTTLAGSASGAELKVVDTNGTASTAGVLGLLTATAPTVNSAALRGQNNATNAFGYGVYGSQAGRGIGVSGFAPTGTGVRGQSTSGIGVVGQHTAATGTAPGVFASTNSTHADAYALVGTITPTSPGLNSEAVRGINNGTGSNGIGVYGQQNGSGYGVYGYSPGGKAVFGTSTSGNGLYGQSSSAEGVIGESSSGSGVFGSSPSGRGVAGFSATWQGVYGNSNSQAGVVGESGSFDGVYGVAHKSGVAGVSGHNDAGGYAVWGGTPSGTAIYGTSANGYGVEGTGLLGVRGIGEQTGVSGSGGSYGVVGSSTDGIGVKGFSTNDNAVRGDSTNNAGVNGFSTNFIGVAGGSQFGHAGYFFGDVVITGGCTGCAGAALQIDDPLDPAHRTLQHSTVVSPQMKDVYDGIVTTNAKGFAIVRLPGYFQALNRSFRYQLTSLSGLQEVAIAKEIAHNRFTIQSEKPHSRISWQVTGIRHDRFANAHPIHVVAPKSKADQGKYLHPELYGKPKSQAIGYQKPSRLPRRAVEQHKR